MSATDAVLDDEECKRLRERCREIAYVGLVKFHAHWLMRCERFRRTSRLNQNDVRSIARDLDGLGRVEELDATIERILELTDALDLERQAAADAAFRKRCREL